MFETKELLRWSEFLVIESLCLIPQYYYAGDGGYSFVDVENPCSTAFDESPLRCYSMFWVSPSPPLTNTSLLSPAESEFETHKCSVLYAFVEIHSSDSTINFISSNYYGRDKNGKKWLWKFHFIVLLLPQVSSGCRVKLKNIFQKIYCQLTVGQQWGDSRPTEG